MRARRLFWFVIAILFGLAASLLYGWVIDPSGRGQVDLASLREDYKADAVLMSAEIFSQDGQIEAAASRLQALDASQPPLRLVQQAILTAQELGYDRGDVELLARLFLALQSAYPESTEAVP